jgi:hypothetical protein
MGVLVGGVPNQSHRPKLMTLRPKLKNPTSISAFSEKRSATRDLRRPNDRRRETHCLRITAIGGNRHRRSSSSG